MKITIDGIDINISSGDKNIVDVADRAHIAIPAPCYRDDRINGCCKTCVVEVDGERKYACETKPLDGMNIIVDRADLNEIEKKNIKKYKEKTKKASSKEGCKCNCNCSEGKNEEGDR